MNNSRINIFTGHYGSGKTEVAVNYAIKVSNGNKTTIVDFDIINPFFRTKNVENLLLENNIRLIAPKFANTNVEILSLPSSINSIFNDKNQKVVFDVGGDPEGARALAIYKDEFLVEDYSMFFVINTCRQMTDSCNKIIRMLQDIERSSGLRVSGLINNTNLLNETTIENILKGHSIIEEAGRNLKLPIVFTSVLSENFNKVNDIVNGEIFCMNKFMNLPWERKSI